MNRDLESSVWRLAQQRCVGSEFLQLIEDAISRYKRVPGFDPPDRLHASEIGVPGIEVLRDVLERHGLSQALPRATSKSGLVSERI